jgi:hypothetical protein
MASIGIFDRLGFPESMANNTIEFSENTQKSLANLPPFLSTWQMEDIANNDTSGYFVNPVSDYANTILSTLQTIKTSANSGNLFAIVTAANSATSSNTFIDFTSHTNRISGVSPIDSENADLPQYNLCIGVGKALTYIIYQSDGISNNAVILGNFGSLYTANTLIQYAANLANDLILIQNSIPAGGGNSNLTIEQSNTIVSDINSTNTFIYNSVVQDVNFYNNSRSVVNGYSSVRGFTAMGDTEKYLINTLVGSNKLKERIS